jgi:mRNA interferase MazF
MFEKGDLVLVPFPLSDLSATKRRPVLTLTGADRYGDFFGMPVTSRPHHAEGVRLSASDVVAGALPVTSCAVCGPIAS